MVEITLKNKTYPILFDLNATEAIQKRYGNIDALGDKLQDYGEIKWILTTIINEGIALKNYEQNTHDAPVTEQQIGMLTSLKDMQNATLTDAILSAFYESFGNAEEIKNQIASEIATAQTR